MRKLFMVVIVFGLLVVAADSTQAINLLTNGNFELGAPPPDFPGWDIFERVPSQPGAVINNLEQPAFAGPPGVDPSGRLAWLRPFAGNQGIFTGQNVLSEAGLSKTVPAQVDESYMFKGWSRFEENYAGGLDTVDGNPSPTTTTWNLDFLDSGGSVIGGASPYNVRADRVTQSFLGIANDGMWYEHSLMATAPANTASVRVTAGGYSLVSNNNANTGPQSAMFDYFSLRSASASGTELLTNPDLNTLPVTPPPLQGWTLVADPATAGDQGSDFADNPNTPGIVGYWVRAFLGAPGNSTLSQRVAAGAGDVFNFSAWAAFGQNYSGGTSGSHPSTATLLEVAFLDSSEHQIGTPTSLDLWNAGLRNATGGITNTPQAWQQFFINGVAAPANSAFVEVRTVVTGASVTMNPDQGAFFDDYVLELASAMQPGDYNNDGKVDAADYVVWRKNLGTNTVLPNDPTGGTIGTAQYNTWKANFGLPPGAGSGTNLLEAVAVPEPAGCVTLLAALFTIAGGRRARVNG